MKYKGGPEIKIPYKYNIKNLICSKEFLIKLIKIQFVLLYQGEYDLHEIKKRLYNDNLRNKIINNNNTTNPANINNNSNVIIWK